MNRKILALKTQLYSTGRFQVVLRASRGNVDAITLEKWEERWSSFVDMAKQQQVQQRYQSSELN